MGYHHPGTELLCLEGKIVCPALLSKSGSHPRHSIDHRLSRKARRESG